jgi:hypothetical protein
MRNSEKTTRQIINAPKNAIYLCISHIEATFYCKRIAYNHNRQDLTFISCGAFHTERLYGLVQYVVLDHAIVPGIDLRFRDYDFIQFHNETVKFKESNQNDKIGKD